MFKINKRIMLALLMSLLFGSINAFACSCASLDGETPSDAVRAAIDNSTAVFAGKVIGFEYRKGIPNEYVESLAKRAGKHFDYETKIVKFQVAKWWKGEVPKEIFLVTSETKMSDGTGSNSSCDYDFKAGENYLVYAYGKAGELKTNACARTGLSAQSEDLKILGEGNAPVEVKAETSDLLNVKTDRANFHFVFADLYAVAAQF